MESGILIGSWKVVVGRDCRGVQLIRYDNIDELPTAAEKRVDSDWKAESRLVESKLLAPLPWSDLQ